MLCFHVVYSTFLFLFLCTVTLSQATILGAPKSGRLLEVVAYEKKSQQKSKTKFMNYNYTKLLLIS